MAFVMFDVCTERGLGFVSRSSKKNAVFRGRHAERSRVAQASTCPTSRRHAVAVAQGQLTKLTASDAMFTRIQMFRELNAWDKICEGKYTCCTSQTL